MVADAAGAAVDAGGEACAWVVIVVADEAGAAVDAGGVTGGLAWAWAVASASTASAWVSAASDTASAGLSAGGGVVLLASAAGWAGVLVGLGAALWVARLVLGLGRDAALGDSGVVSWAPAIVAGSAMAAAAASRVNLMVMTSSEYRGLGTRFGDQHARARFGSRPRDGPTLKGDEPPPVRRFRRGPEGS
jgi:hypothetical protein